MNKLCSQIFKTLINELNRPGSAQGKNFSEKSYIYVDKNEIFLVLHDKVALLTSRRSELGARDRH